MRLYLDTNILVFLITNMRDEISQRIWDLINDYENILMTSYESVRELIYLYLAGKIPKVKNRPSLRPSEVIACIKKMNIQIVPISEHHLQMYSELPFYDDHKDPSDRLIIAQAIADKVSLVSSDRKFNRYEKNGLEFLYNER